MIELVIPRELKSPNAWLWKHWRVKQKERQTWEQEIRAALPLSTLLKESDQHQVKRVTVTRYVPSRRNFIKDADNLRFSVKPVNDALKRLGLIRDDSEKWMQQTVSQKVSTLKRYATCIQIQDAQ